MEVFLLGEVFFLLTRPLMGDPISLQAPIYPLEVRVALDLEQRVMVLMTLIMVVLEEDNEKRED